jgi:hypothetical protein
MGSSPCGGNARHGVPHPGPGLRRRTTQHGVQRVQTGLGDGWYWSSFCKTQYASNPSIGDTENFLRCHLSVIGLLGFAKELGTLDEVSDEPAMNYWTLIDRQQDPHELRNVYGDAAYADAQKELHAELVRLRKELKVPEQDAPASLVPADRAPRRRGPATRNEDGK